ncbi:hypothetical protein SDRG_15191 [Saprolegnia diclina VS20]|uniref:sn-1-specific diacylglycerol lipase n=1 Tax=Saprolegnia diclina (strain VS20) TaxID=1156394 RepID=T0PXM9_SAPDV|nr:hypothetical protein SDRG_15191 [Saprolegnia diclina VS20]EQC26976.1 hypothetical protein SDRG_15191 [Saprolegnia diclina VS20]|eukprot:XP_008619578.1 hypothetical protein SDRG_15191 [Saprolegnia diclina VS20]
MDEVVENQRWYALSGWSDKLLEKDPPAWSDAARRVAKAKPPLPHAEWHFYRSDEYDENGWIYSASFDLSDFGAKNAASVVRSRIWLKASTEPVQAPTALTHLPLSPVESVCMEAPPAASASIAEAPPLKEADPAPTSAPVAVKQGGYLSRFSSAALNVSKSAVDFAASKSVGAVLTAALSVHEVSAYAYDTAHAAAVSALAADTAAAPPRPKGPSAARSPNASTRRFPDLTPMEKAMVSCCADLAVHPVASAPEPVLRPDCTQCKSPFGISKYRYHCGYCGEAYCRDHLPATERLHAFGGASPVKICATCVDFLAQKIDVQQRNWRVERVRDYLDRTLAPYVSVSTDTALDKAFRAAEGTLAAAKAAPLGATAKMAVVSADFLRKYGRAGLIGFVLRNEFMQSFNTLKALLGDMESLSVQDAAVGLYYFMATNRGHRGGHPLDEREMHNGCPTVPDALLHELIRFAPITLHAIYELDILDIQRFVKLQGFTLLFASVEHRTANQPAFGLVARADEKLAVLLVRGSKSVQDILTDLQVAPGDASSHGPLDAFAHHGMAQAAAWMKAQTIDALRELHGRGYRLMVNGHSLGGGVAALLAVMLHTEFPDVKCYAYAVPACANRETAAACAPYVHSVVLRDDFVPRAKTHNIVRLSTELKAFRDDWKNTALEDWTAVKSRVKSVWAPRKREWATMEAARTRGTLLPTSETPLVNAATPSREAAVDAWTLTRSNLVDKYSESNGSSPKAPETPQTTDKEGDDGRAMETDNAVELFVPGQIVHLYHTHGVYDAAFVDRDCDALGKIHIFENMLSDHLGRNYLAALRIVRDARKASSPPPAWVCFGTHTRCMCCEAPFTWNSTSQSEAQANRDQHNCRSCGWLVCDGCSEKRKPLPEYGINTPVRVCDKCFYKA